MRKGSESSSASGMIIRVTAGANLKTSPDSESPPRATWPTGTRARIMPGPVVAGPAPAPAPA